MEHDRQLVVTALVASAAIVECVERVFQLGDVFEGDDDEGLTADLEIGAGQCKGGKAPVPVREVWDVGFHTRSRAALAQCLPDGVSNGALRAVGSEAAALRVVEPMEAAQRFPDSLAPRISGADAGKGGCGSIRLSHRECRVDEDHEHGRVLVDGGKLRVLVGKDFLG